jgi:DNA (cytosine-5)-methyltransferase 1
VRLLDLFCGAGGAAMGYHRAGFDEIVGVDNRPQPRYPFTFVLDDALEYVAAHGREFDAIHASPPCQGYSIMRNLPWLRHKEYPLLIQPTADALNAIGLPWIIENVMGAKLASGWLCGTMFGLPFFRHRFFWTGDWFWLQPSHKPHTQRIRSGHYLAGRARDIVCSAAEDSRGIQTWSGRRPDGGHGLTLIEASPYASFPGQRPDNGALGHSKGARKAGLAMGIDWMKSDEISQAIPPAYTEFIGRQLMQVLC